MQSLFETYLRLGFEHISDITAYDHILFIVALCAVYQLKAWKQVAILVTAFTLGHSITLALAVLDIIRFRAEVIEFLIPITIIITCIYNIIKSIQNRNTPASTNTYFQLNYGFALGFGLIHGMGFSNFLRAMLMPDQGNSILIQQLLAFNIGIELGQLLIVAVTLVLSFFALNILKIRTYYWTIGLSIVCGLIALRLLL